MNNYQQSDLGGLLSTASAVTAVVRDPYLPRVAKLVLELRDMESSSNAENTGSSGSGIGLRNIVGPLEIYVAVQKKPWVLPATVVGVFGLIFAAGYFSRKTKR